MGVFFTDDQNEQGEKAAKKGAATTGADDHSECIRILNLVLDGEATDAQKAYFKKHIQDCMPYYEIYHLEKTIRTLIKDKCKCCDKQVPSDLVDTIRLKISENYKP